MVKNKMYNLHVHYSISSFVHYVIYLHNYNIVFLFTQNIFSIYDFKIKYHRQDVFQKSTPLLNIKCT